MCEENITLGILDSTLRSWRITNITRNDQNGDFKNNPKCCLTNQTKSEIGIISKYYLY